MAGNSVLAGAATLATSSFHSAMLLGWMSQGSGGAATSGRICALMSSGTGSVYAGISRPCSMLGVCAETAVADTAKADTTAILRNIITTSSRAGPEPRSEPACTITAKPCSFQEQRQGPAIECVDARQADHLGHCDLRGGRTEMHHSWMDNACAQQLGFC